MGRGRMRVRLHSISFWAERSATHTALPDPIDSRLRGPLWLHMHRRSGRRVCAQSCAMSALHLCNQRVDVYAGEELVSEECGEAGSVHRGGRETDGEERRGGERGDCTTHNTKTKIE